MATTGRYQESPCLKSNPLVIVAIRPPEVTETATKPSPSSLVLVALRSESGSKNSLGGCTIDMPPSLPAAGWHIGTPSDILFIEDLTQKKLFINLWTKSVEHGQSMV